MSDQDPAVSGWQAATEAHMAASTSALGRNLQTALDQLRDEYNAELAARVAAEKERDTLREVAQGNKRHVGYLTVENEQMRAAIEGLIAQRDSANQRWADVRIVAENLRAFVDEFVDPDPCWYDHNGYCQAHSLDPAPCPHQRAKELP